MTLVDLLRRDQDGPRPDWDTPPPPEYPPHSREWYEARAVGRLEEYERGRAGTVLILDAAPES